jgi:hypothetical protein
MGRGDEREIPRLNSLAPFGGEGGPPDGGSGEGAIGGYSEFFHSFEVQGGRLSVVLEVSDQDIPRVFSRLHSVAATLQI